MQGATGSVLVKVFDVLLGLATSLVLARALEPAGLGTYSFALALTGLMAVPVQMGLPTLVIREVARYQHTGRWDLIRGILRRTNQVIPVLSLIACAIAAIILLMQPSGASDVQSVTLLWALLLVPLMALNRVREASLFGLGCVVQAQIPEKVVLRGAAFALLMVAWRIGALDAPRAMMINIAAVTLAFVVGSHLLRRALPAQVRAASPSYEDAAWSRSILPLSLLAGVSIIASQSDTVVIGILSTKEAVGLYRVAFSGAALVIFLATAVNATLGARIARLHIANEKVRLQKLVTIVTRSTLLVSLPVAGGLVLFGGPILEMVYGSVYRPAYPALAILCVGQLVNVATGPALDILSMTGHEGEALKYASWALLANVVLDVFLVPFFGPAGAAAATACSIAAVNLIMCRIVWLRTGIWTLAFAPRWLVVR